MLNKFVVLISTILFGSIAVSQTLPASNGTNPQPSLFAPGTISGAANELSPAFTPDGRTVYFTVSNGTDVMIVVSHLQGKQWTRPVVAPFSGKWHDFEAAMSPDGSFLVFASNRPVETDGKALNGFFSGKVQTGGGGNLWKVERQGSGWGQPVRLPDTVNATTSVFSPSVVRDGSLYFMKASPDGARFQIYRSQLKNGQYQPAELSTFSNESWNNVDPAVAPDESFAIFSSNRTPTTTGDLDLFIVFSRDGHWGEPVHMGSKVNCPTSDIEARLSPDWHTLYFSSRRTTPVPIPKTKEENEQSLLRMRSWDNGLTNIWQVDLSSWLASPAPAAMKNR